MPRRLKIKIRAERGQKQDNFRIFTDGDSDRLPTVVRRTGLGLPVVGFAGIRFG